jgi:hypothetical protein
VSDGLTHLSELPQEASLCDNSLAWSRTRRDEVIGHSVQITSLSMIYVIILVHLGVRVGW